MVVNSNFPVGICICISDGLRCTFLKIRVIESDQIQIVTRVLVEASLAMHRVWEVEIGIAVRITVRRVVQHYAATGAAPVPFLEEGPASTG